MEISVQGVNSLKIKGKSAAIFINPQDKTAAYNAAILLGNPSKSSLKIRDDVVIIDGPGEYETGGIKISGFASDNKTVYSISVDNVEIVLGDIDAVEKIHQKLKEHNVAVINAQVVGNTSFLTGLGTNALLFFGEKANEVVDTLAKDEKKEMTKYTISRDKLPVETETVLLKND